MTQPVESPVDAMVGKLDLEAVSAWLEEQRWYASKSRRATGSLIGAAQMMARGRCRQSC